MIQVCFSFGKKSPLSFSLSLNSLVLLFLFTSPGSSPRGPPGRPSAAQALLEVRREARRRDAAAARRAGHVPSRRGLQGLPEGVDSGEADGRGSWRSWRSWISRRRSCGGGGSCFGLSVSGGEGGEASLLLLLLLLRNGTTPLQRGRPLQVHTGGGPRGRVRPPGPMRLDGDVGDEFWILLLFFPRKGGEEKAEVEVEKKGAISNAVPLSPPSFSFPSRSIHLPGCRCTRPRPALLSSG